MEDTGHTRPLREVVDDLVDRLHPLAQELDCADELADLLRITAEGPSYVRQRRVMADTGSLPEVVSHLRGEFDESVRAEGAPGT